MGKASHTLQIAVSLMLIQLTPIFPTLTYMCMRNFADGACVLNSMWHHFSPLKTRGSGMLKSSLGIVSPKWSTGTIKMGLADMYLMYMASLRLHWHRYQYVIPNPI